MGRLAKSQSLLTRYVCSTSPEVTRSPTRKATGAQGFSDSEKLTAIIDFNRPLDTSKLVDKTIIVTGGASGIGAAIVLRLSELGLV